jgi:hypothetical protein
MNQTNPSSPNPPANPTRAFVLRLRCAGGNCHAVLIDSTTGERHGFANLEALFVFLVQQASTIDNLRNRQNKSPAS